MGRLGMKRGVFGHVTLGTDLDCLNRWWAGNVWWRDYVATTPRRLPFWPRKGWPPLALSLCSSYSGFAYCRTSWTPGWAIMSDER